MSYGVYLIIVLVIPIIVDINVKLTFNKYSKVGNARRLTAQEVARHILDSNGLYNTRIAFKPGKLSDCYDPRDNTVYLSNSSEDPTSVAAIGVAAHECGHACQHADNYTPIRIRTAIAPVTNICSRFWYYVLILGVILSSMTIGTGLIIASIVMFLAVVIFQIVTLPAELNASRRAMETLERDGILEADELPMAGKVLRAAALTYVASLVASIVQLLRLVLNARRR